MRAPIDDLMENILYWDGTPDRYKEAIAKVYGLEVPEEYEDDI